MRSESRLASARPPCSTVAGRSRLGRASALASSAGTLVLTALVPKCPLCVAAMLSAWGVGAGVAGTVAPAVRPVVFAAAAVAAIAFFVFELSRAKNRERHEATARNCCSGST